MTNQGRNSQMTACEAPNDPPEGGRFHASSAALDRYECLPFRPVDTHLVLYHLSMERHCTDCTHISWYLQPEAGQKLPPIHWEDYCTAMVPYPTEIPY